MFLGKANQAKQKNNSSLPKQFEQKVQIRHDADESDESESGSSEEDEESESGEEEEDEEGWSESTASSAVSSSKEASTFYYSGLKIKKKIHKPSRASYRKFN